MPVTTPRLALNLFWRTFALLALLLAAGVLAWQQTFKALEAEPKALEAAQQLAGLVNLSPRGDWRAPSDSEAAAWLENLKTPSATTTTTRTWWWLPTRAPRPSPTSPTASP